MALIDHSTDIIEFADFVFAKIRMRYWHQETEPGSSLKAVNFNAAAKTGFFKGGWQNRSDRKEYTPIRKIRWEKFL